MNHDFKLNILIDWERGWYSLGWRGWLARILLKPVLEEEAQRLEKKSPSS